ncbi:hypothetical protein DTL42_24205 [Bremerella cremea]|uniref:Uncharacterized protein n=1 Tax=Bremerella cremea TaxID=1031537 RepID=A0A368KIS1_9BACT|nr:hypothetical protein [Bremerella cremea]RCS40481.1 hypothetical protein DTL42_24205 [Bremerella cremea]
MTGQVSGIRYQRIRAPRGHGESLVVPCPVLPGTLVESNRQGLDHATTSVARGTTLGALREEVRGQLLQRARDYTQQYREIEPTADPTAPLILSGHQPALYHPGVWFKNFLIDRIATKVSGTAINVIIDNDVAPAPSISALQGTPDDPQPARIAYDEPGPRLPWEMTKIESLDTLLSFAERVQATFKTFVSEPLLASFWPEVLSAVEAGKPLGLAFSQARNRLEADCGLKVLDIPLSQLCQTDGFWRMFVGIVEEAERYREIYNACVDNYRAVHGIRSSSHPVPNLGADESWTEVPFWVWTAENPRRRPLWIAHTENGIRLTDRAAWQAELSGRTDWVSQLHLLSDQGVCVRPRALATTTILRLAASDLFVHGIGGAKYDQVTNEIIRQFYGVQPPQYVTATASALLPMSRPEEAEDELFAIERKLRDVTFNPDRAVENQAIDDPQWKRLLQQKSDLLRNVPALSEKSLWHQQLQKVNDQLRELITEPVARLRIERDRLFRQQHQTRLLTSREFPFILFPQEGLRNLLLDLAVKDL